MYKDEESDNLSFAWWEIVLILMFIVGIGGIITLIYIKYAQ